MWSALAVATIAIVLIGGLAISTLRQLSKVTFELGAANAEIQKLELEVTILNDALDVARGSSVDLDDLSMFVAPA